MAYFRASFPEETFAAHLLKEHAVIWIGRYGVGCGMLGEQGIESVHARFNSLQQTYSRIPQRVKRLKCIVKDYLISIAPENVIASTM